MAEWRDKKGVLCVGLKAKPVSPVKQMPEAVPIATEAEKPKRGKKTKKD